MALKLILKIYNQLKGIAGALGRIGSFFSHKLYKLLPGSKSKTGTEMAAVVAEAREQIDTHGGNYKSRAENTLEARSRIC